MSQRKPPPKIGAPAAELLPAVLESLLFVAEEPQEITTLAKTVELPRQRVEQALEELAQAGVNRGLFVQRHGDRVQLATVPDAAPYIERFLEVEHGRLSRAALETLAIIAYRQPVTRAVIESVRGVNADHAVSMLLARELIEEVGRAPGPGRPVLFATTVRFLEYFGLRRPEDLPPLPEATAEGGGGGEAAAERSQEASTPGETATERSQEASTPGETATERSQEASTLGETATERSQEAPTLPVSSPQPEAVSEEASHDTGAVPSSAPP